MIIVACVISNIMKITVICKKEVVYKNGTSPLFVRFIHNKSKKLVSTGVNIKAEYWDITAQMLAPGCPNRQLLQSKLDAITEAYNKQIRRLEALETEPTIEALFGEKKLGTIYTIENYFERIIDDIERRGKHNTASKYKTTLSTLKIACKTNVRFEQINAEYLSRYEDYLIKRECSENSIATRMAVLKAVYRKALSEKAFTSSNNPFDTYKVGSHWKTTRKRAITKEEVQKIIDLEIPHNYRTNYKRFAKDVFLFSYFTAGMNFGDMARLKHSDIVRGRVYYSRHKTEKMLSCQLTEMATTIIEKYRKPDYQPGDYVFPILNRGIHITERQIFDRLHKALAKVNNALKEIGQKIGLPFPLTTYVARHTFATVLKRSGVNVALISEALGHSDLSTTQIYLDSFENAQLDEAMKNLL